jgi:hypothetical protein
MIPDIAQFILAAGLPYYLLLEKITFIKSKHIFIISATLLLIAIVLSNFFPNSHLTSFVILSLLTSLFSIYKATKTTNFYKLGYYLIFVNAPFFILFENEGAMYSVSLLVSLIGLYLIGQFYEKNYGSANYHHITGITLVRPYIGTFLVFYLIALALYPPFPNSLYFLSHIFHSELSLLWYMVTITLFFGNFFIGNASNEKNTF